MSIPRNLASLGSVLGVAVIAGCSGGSSPPPQGTVSVSLMDRPIDGITALFVTITEVRIKPAGNGPAFSLPMTTSPLTMNLLEYDAENASVLVHEALVDAISYNWIELVIDDSTIDKSYALTLEGGMERVDIDVPSDSIRLVSGFDVEPNQGLRVLLDWDVRKGLTEAVGSGELKLRPAFRILDVDEYGAVEGTIYWDRIMQEGSCPPAFLPGEEPVVYVFEADETPDEIDNSTPEPITAMRASVNMDGDYVFRIALMPDPAGYIVAATCAGHRDTDAHEGDIDFFPPGGLGVTIASPAELDIVDFEPI
jgi:hypothetical protein